MNLYPGEREDKKGDTSFDLCVERGIVAIGWCRLNKHVKTTSPKVYAESAAKIIPRKYRNGKAELEKWRRQFRTLSGMKKGDLVWTKRSRGHFYLNRVLDTEVTPLYGEDYSRNDFGSARKCEWNEVTDDLEVPAEIKRNTRGTIRTVKDPKNKALALSEQLYNELRGDQVLPLRELKGELFDFLAPEDVEDLMGLYLQATKNLLIVPSTSKQATSPVEFLMIDRETGEEVGVQVKTGNQVIHLADYKDAPKKNYFFQERPKSEVVKNGNAVFVEKRELLDFAESNPAMLPDSIRRLMGRLAK
jgi:hypothetical protein